MRREIFVRDGWICGYCGIRTVDQRARKRLVTLTGIAWGDRDAARHAALLNVSAVVDHVHPAAAFDSTGKMSYICADLGMAVPVAPATSRTGWDGLTRLLPRPG